MPIYEYECRRCKTHVEIFQKMNDKPLARCRKCGGRLEKLMSASAIQFKGEGWYVTDYARKGKKEDEKQTAEPTARDKPKEGPATKKAGSSEKTSAGKPTDGD